MIGRICALFLAVEGVFLLPALLLSLLHEGLFTEREAHIVYAAVTDRTLENAAPDKRDALRADILRTFLLTLRTLRRTK